MADPFLLEARGLTALGLAWMAGFFDGEGCICIRRNGRGYSLLVQITQTVNVFRPFKEAFGGGITEWQPKQPRCRRLWDWRATGAEAASFLRLIRPFLVVKQQEADIALEFLDWYSPIARRGRNKLPLSLIKKAAGYRDRLKLVRRRDG